MTVPRLTPPFGELLSGQALARLWPKGENIRNLTFALALALALVLALTLALPWPWLLGLGLGFGLSLGLAHALATEEISPSPYQHSHQQLQPAIEKSRVRVSTKIPVSGFCVSDSDSTGNPCSIEMPSSTNC